MSDIVERLLEYSNHGNSPSQWPWAMKEAAKDITRLRAERDDWHRIADQRAAEIGRLRTELKEFRDAAADEMARLRAELDLATFNRALEKTLAAECDRLRAEIERLRAREKTLENTARINLSVAQRAMAENKARRGND